MDERYLSIFLDVQSGLPRQGPGDDDSTRRALKLCDLPDNAAVLDIGCGPGAQTMIAAEQLPGAMFTAVDFHAPYLEQLKERARTAGYAGRITTHLGDMNALPFAPQSFDLILAEGSAYIMGFANALKSWKALLKDDGYIAATELVWLTETPPQEAVSFFNEEYPAMARPANIIKIFEESGYRVLGHFTVPDKGWWDEYYTPLAGRLDMLEEKYAGDELGLSIIQATRQEQYVRRNFGESYGYEFFVARKLSER